jgi:hypothetical protein
MIWKSPQLHRLVEPQNRPKWCSDELPVASDTTEAQGANGSLEGRGCEIDVVGGASGAKVDNANGGRLAIVGDSNVLVAGRLVVEDRRGNRGNKIGIGVGLAAGTKASVVVGDLTSRSQGLRNDGREGNDGEGNESADEEHRDGYIEKVCLEEVEEGSRRESERV